MKLKIGFHVNYRKAKLPSKKKLYGKYTYLEPLKIEKHAKNTPAIPFSNNEKINNLHIKLLEIMENDETNETVFLVKDAPVPAGSTLELLAGNKVVLQATDVMKIDCDVAAKIDATLSIMEIT